jgi:CHAT domain-containing protein
MELARLRDVWPADAMLLEYFQSDGAWWAFTLNGRSFQETRLPIDGDFDLAGMIRRFVALVLARARRAAILSAGHELYRLVWKPIADRIQGSLLYVVPHGPLHGLPFGALHDGRVWLIEAAPPICVTPSASILARLWGGTPILSPRFLGIANPGCPELSGVFQEVRDCAKLYPDSTVLPADPDGSYPTRAAFLESSPAANIVHLACHGRLLADPLECGFQLWANDRPDWFTVRDISALRLRAHLLVASICYGGTGNLAGGDEWLGLLRAFFGAGARAVVAPRWELADDAAPIIMRRFHASLAQHPDRGVAAALHKAASGLARDSAFRHPFYWSSLGIWGDGGPVCRHE